MTSPETLKPDELVLKPCPFCGNAAKIEHSYHEDSNRYPRDFWHCHVRCSACSMADTGWSSYGEQEQRNVPPEVRAAAEAREVEYWNRRAPDAALQSDLERVTADLGRMRDERDALTTIVASGIDDVAGAELDDLEARATTAEAALVKARTALEPFASDLPMCAVNSDYENARLTLIEIGTTKEKP